MENLPTSENLNELIMPYRVSKILLVSSSYDQFTLEEDGVIETQLHNEYAELSLTAPPKIRRVSSAVEALELIDKGKFFDLILCTFNIGDISPFEFSKMLKERKCNIAFVLLTSFSREITRRLECEDTSCIDYVFAWQGNAELILAIIKMLEDEHNAVNDMEGLGVQGIILVEDSVRFYSAYLPDLYQIVLQQTETTAAEALNKHQRMLRKRARPKILFARTLEQAFTLYNRHKNNLLGVISDVSFAANDTDPKIKKMAGIELCTTIREQDSRIPILLQSSDSSMKSKADAIGADFIYKNSKTLFSEMSTFIHQRLAFGNFIFTDPKTGEFIAKAGDLQGLQKALEIMTDDILLYYSGQNMFSKWLYARGLFEIAHKIRIKFIDHFSNTDELRHYLIMVIKDYRRSMGRGVIAEFNASTYNEHITFARSGSGSLGGKARGLAFIDSIIENYNLYEKWDNVLLTIPRTLALTTEHFEAFMKDNALHYVVSEEMSDVDILNEFIAARLPEKLLEHLRVFLLNVHRPLAVRSSSKLEDSHYQPFAGIYSTYMVPRTENQDRDLRIVSKAIKSVYASVFFAASRSYIASTGNLLSEEGMGVVIQELCGSEQDGYYFPTFSGVARSINFYPIGDELPQQGVCSVAFGLGKTVVEGGSTMRFSPAYPRHALQLTSPDIMRRDAQRNFYALDLNPSSLKTSVDDASNFRCFDINDGVKFRNMKFVASTWDMEGERVVDSFSQTGYKLITFANILKYDTFPLASIIRELLDIGQREMLSPVEIEFAVNMDVEDGQKAIFNFLQIRPIAFDSRSESLDWNKVDSSSALLYAQKALGTGAISGVQDFLYVRPENFSASKNEAIAAEIGAINETFKEQNRGYVLVGPGRWGSNDHWLGIPVNWSQICQSKVIAECGLENFRIDPSQGTHFFQNLTSFGVGYLTLNPFMDDGIFNLDTLNNMKAEYESDNLRLVHFEHPLYIFIDGKNNKAIIEVADSATK